jgi:hypothetical protein
MRECQAQFSARLFEGVRTALEGAGDLFESGSHIPDGEVQAFREKLPGWQQAFERSMGNLVEQRLAGTHRRGRRPDANASLSTLQVLTPFDHERQAALVNAVAVLHRFTKRELDALDLRIGELLVVAPGRDIDNPFSPSYILDALGPTSRRVFASPRVWRPLMERLLADLTPAVNKIYISLNRMLADRGVLPEIKAALRARSEWRPADDKDLLPTFTRMMSEVDHALPTDIVVPAASPETGTSGAAHSGAAEVPAGAAPAGALSAYALPVGANGAAAETGGTANMLPPAAILAGLAALAALGARSVQSRAPDAGAEAAASASPHDFPDLDAGMALVDLKPVIATLGHRQRVDLAHALADAVRTPDGASGSVPLNLVPHIRAAVADGIENPTDRIAMDVIALLFDYVFRDPSIADSQRRIFGRLQVPIVKAALLDREFFSDRNHPARRLLDLLAEAAVGATGEDAYRDAFDNMATRVVETVCRDFEVDLAVFNKAISEIQAFVDSERRETAPALRDDVAAALADEEHEADRAQVRALLRDRLAGIDLPFEVRSFAETVWADYLTALRKRQGGESAEWTQAQQTLDDLLWSIVAKERTAQKARLTKMIPSLVTGLRKGCTMLDLPADRSRAFFDTLYGLHMAAIKPAPQPAAVPAVRAAVVGASAIPTLTETAIPLPPGNVHDFVDEMVVGTWLRFDADGAASTARLSWVSPLRSKYIFTSRSHIRAFVMTPEELAWKLVNGKASLILEPVPLFDRAVSAALDTLAARKPASGNPPAGQAATVH